MGRSCDFHSFIHISPHISIYHFAGWADRPRHRKNRRRSNRLRAGEAIGRSLYSHRKTDRPPWASLLFQRGHTLGKSTLTGVRLLHSCLDSNICSHYRFKGFIPLSDNRLFIGKAARTGCGGTKRLYPVRRTRNEYQPSTPIPPMPALWMSPTFGSLAT